ncbi:hypothetical protein [Pararhodospirillum photometricum]|nr:hypothetical protein [Pararhodospirillum photometricum]
MRDLRVAGFFVVPRGASLPRRLMPFVIALALTLPGLGTARAANGETFRALSPEASLTPLIQGESIAPEDHPAIVEEALQALDYSLDAVRDGFVEVPPVFLARVPTDLNTLGWGETRKTTFQKVLLPLILAVNADITEERARLLDLQASLAQGQPLTRLDQDWLARLADRYEIASPSPEALLIRVDAVPPSLALGQSALETGWGAPALCWKPKTSSDTSGAGALTPCWTRSTPTSTTSTPIRSTRGSASRGPRPEPRAKKPSTAIASPPPFGATPPAAWPMSPTCAP